MMAMSISCVPIWLLSGLAAISAALAMPESSEAASLRPELARHHDDRITWVPGFDGELPSRMYGGYITVDEAHGRHLYYLFVTSQRSPANDPVVLWLNGGPGCSSFDGFVYEHGPFSMEFEGGKDAEGRTKQQLLLKKNPHSWSKVANVLYVDSPAGVGMSYSETPADYHTNDTHTAADLNTFLRRWFLKFEEFQGSDFYVSGESFAGVYVPLTSQAVLDGNDAGQSPKINIKGYLVGNGVTDPQYDGNAVVPFARGKSLISSQLYHEAHAACDEGLGYWNATPGSQCDRMLNEVWARLSGVNMYDILHSCYHGHNPYHGPDPLDSQQQQQQQQGEQGSQQATESSSSTSGSSTNDQAAAQGQPHRLLLESQPSPSQLQEAMQSLRQWPLLGGAKPGPVPGLVELGLAHIPPCLDSREMWAFCNDPEVRQAIHAAPIDAIGHFDECTNGQRIRYTHNVPSMLPVHQDLLARGLDALVYSGDHDLAVPHTGTESWTASLGLQERQRWKAWYVKDKQVAGYAVHYQGLVYATVKGAGHMVPETNPEEALVMFERFLRFRQL